MGLDYIHDGVPEPLVERLVCSRNERRFRRRAVLLKTADLWQLVCCTVEGFLPGQSLPEAVPSRRYPQAILSEDFLTGAECLAFANQIQERNVLLDKGIRLLPNEKTQWSLEAVAVNNDYMSRSGHVISANFTQRRVRSAATALLMPDAPYYPDIGAAAGDWLPFTVYHGESDGRNDQIVFLLPETRAFVAESMRSAQETIEIIVGGGEAHTLPLLIKGAYWRGKAIYQLDATIRDGQVSLSVPSDADRLEYYLMDRAGRVYDFHREDRYSRLSVGRSVLGAARRTLAEEIWEASVRDEGRQIEFKPFIEPEQSIGTSAQKTKMREIVATAVAFANTEGGRLYLGIDDDCTITGVNTGLQAWVNSTSGKARVDEAAISRYRAALKSKIKESISGDIMLRLEHARVGEAIVIVVEVSKATTRPLAILDDHYLYVRIGHRTRKLPPDQWTAFLMPDRPVGAFLGRS
jgi:hypothetical protein